MIEETEPRASESIASLSSAVRSSLIMRAANMRAAVDSLFGKHKLASSVAALGSGAVAAQILSAVGTVWTARLYAPDAFGIMALFSAVSLFFLPIVSGRYETAVMLPDSDADAATLVGISCAIAVASSSVLALATLVFNGPIARLLDLKTGMAALWTVGAPTYLLILAINQVLGYWCTRIRAFRQMAISRVLTAVITTAAQLGLYWSGMHTGEALVLGAILGQAVGTAQLLFVSIREREISSFWCGSWRSKLAIMMEHQKFPLYGAPYSFIGGAGRQLIAIILRTFGGLHVLGLFFVAMRTVYLPVSLVAGSVRPAFYQVFCTESSVERMSALANKIIRSLSTAGMPILIFFCFNASKLFRIFLGPSWEDAGSYAWMLAVVAFVTITVSWLDRVFDAKGKQHWALVWETAHTLLTLASLIAGLLWFTNTIYAVAIYVSVDMVCECAWVRIAFKAGGFDFDALLKTLHSLGTSTVVFAALMLTCRFAPQNLQLILSITVTVVVVAMTLWWQVTARQIRCSGAVSLPLEDRNG